jgi:phage antirepressor YoqD-like protein
MNELDLFTEPEKMMTVREVAEILDVSGETVRANGKKLFPEVFMNGRTTYFNEAQVTAIKLEIDKHHNLQTTLELPRTDLEKELLIAQAMQFQQEKILKLQQLLLIQAPKVEQFDKLMKTESMMCISDACKHFGIQPIKYGMPALRANGYLTMKNMPTQRSIDLGIMLLKETIGNDNFSHRQAVVSANQLFKFGKVLERITREIE